MTAIEDRPTIAERYSAATESSNLKVEARRRGDADMLIAAGWLPDSLGALLLRLRSEYEIASGDIGRARLYATACLDAAHLERETAKRLRKTGEIDRADEALKAAADLSSDARRTLMTEHALALTRLKTLREARDALGRFAVQQATKQRYMVPDKVVLALVGRVLDVHLDPLCHACAGRSFTGGSHRADKKVLCRECGATGHRKDAVGQNDRERWFARHLLAEMERVLARAAGGMSASLRPGD
ncbi:MAG: hypothetical protein RIQ53_2677 [Pseudomonadota bacterium]|jgi:hypothetical protein